MARLRFRQLWLWWAFVALLSVLCATLGVVQSRWLDEIGVAEQERAHAALDSQLMALSRDFDRRIGSACAGLDSELRGDRAPWEYRGLLFNVPSLEGV